ncbi:MAG: hypothetical protein AB8B85_16910 [Paracoccaceae bacterium]
MTDTQPRRLEDFEPLTSAEQKVLDELDTGEEIVIGNDVPDADAGEHRLIRARFLRWVILGCEGSDGYRLHESGVMIQGALITGEGEDRTTHAALDLEGAEVQQDLLLVNCRFTATLYLSNADMQAVILDRSHLQGLNAHQIVALRGVFLRRVESGGEIGLIGAQIGGNLECNGAKLRNAGDKALDANGARITGTFFWREGAFAEGAIVLTNAEIGSINDDPKCWPGKGDLLLDRCRYGAFTGPATNVTGKARIDWLSRQDLSKYGVEFAPSAYEQCAKVLREMGHQDDAREILIEKERRLREARRAKLSGPQLWWRGFWDRFLALTVCYGQKPLNAGYWLAGFWLLGTLAFAYIHAQDQFKPNNAFVLRADEWAHCSAEHAPPFAYLGDAGQSQLGCFHAQSEAKGLPAFNPFVYSLDVLFPLVQLEQQVHWIPDDDQTWGAAGKALVYVQIVMGWLLSLLAVAGLSGIIKSD